MRILVVGQVFYPDNFRVNNIVKELAKENEVTVVTGLPDYDLGKLPFRYRFLRNRRENYHGATIIRVPTALRRKGPVFRSLNYVSYALSGSLYTLFTKKRYDVVFSFQTSPITMFIPGLAYAKRHKIPTVLYTLDLWPESAKAMNIKENSRAFELILKLSKWIYQSADVVLTSSPSFKDYLVDLIQLNENRVFYLPQYTDEEAEVPIQRTNFDVVPVRFIFAGNIGYMQDLEVLIDAVELIKSENFVVNIVGNGTNMSKLNDMVSLKGLREKIHFHGRKTHSEINEIYSNSDVCILTLKNEGYIGKTIPGKFQTYLAKGKAIVGAISNDTKKIIEENELGLVVESGDYIGLANNMLDFIKFPEQIQKLSCNSYKYYQENYTKDKFILSLNKFLKGDYKNV